MVLHRLTAPKEIQTCDPEGVLERYFTMKGNRDLNALLSNLHENTTWKNAPKASCLASYSPLYAMFVALSPQGLLPAKKLSLAIMACPKSRPVNFSGKELTVFADDMPGVLRASFAKFRSLASDGEAHRRCFSKVFVHQVLLNLAGHVLQKNSTQMG
jgi:hypothetical protein